jgi:hypothetical protein
MNEREKQRQDTFDFIVRRALEPDNHPDTAKVLYIQTGELQRKKREWLEYCKEKLKEEEPIERYCYDIRGIAPDYDLSFEEHLKCEQEWENIRRARMQQFDKEIEEEASGFYRVKPEGMTNRQWIEEKRKRERSKREDRKERESDEKLERQNPFHLFKRRVDKIGCECKAEAMRRGIFCNTCKLIIRVDEYMLELFKKASQGRTTF